MTTQLDLWRGSSRISDERLIDLFSYLVYWEQVKGAKDFIPTETFNKMRSYKF
jgi:hypothetical protein